MKQVQISEDLFLSLIKYHILEYYNEEEKIVNQLNEKLDRIVNRKLYTKYKTALTEEEKEKARQEYLDRKGIPLQFSMVGFFLVYLKQKRDTFLFFS